MTDDNQTRSINVRVPIEDYLLMEKIAHSYDRSLSAQTRIAVREHLAAFKRFNPEVFNQISESVSREISPAEF